MRDWHEKNKDPEKQREYYRNYYAENAAVVIMKTKAYRQTERGKEVRRTAGANQKLHNAKRVAARQIVRMAIVGGILTKKPCERCGALEVEAHHEDYDKPLEVNWLCPPDHKQLHRERRDGASTPKARSSTGQFTGNKIAATV